MTSSRPGPIDARERTIRGELGRGVPIPDRLRRPLERVSGADLVEVRLHDDATADALAAAVHADAFTTGADVFFRSDALRLDSDAGVRVLAHEVAHVAQQAGGRRIATQEAEHEADASDDATNGAGRDAVDDGGVEPVSWVGRRRRPEQPRRRFPTLLQ